MNKKAYMRTIEVTIAIMLALIFLTYLMPKTPSKIEDKNFDVSILLKDDFFRECSVNNNYTCMNEKLRVIIPNTYYAVVNDSTFYYPDTTSNVFVESLIVSGTIDDFNPRILRIYYWKK